MRISEEEFAISAIFAMLAMPAKLWIRCGARGECQHAFLVNPVRMKQVRDIAFGGEVLPQKSTDFYCRLSRGLTIYALE